jgi:hypothetical protein
LFETKSAKLDGLKKKYPQAFRRKHHPGTGLPLKKVLASGMLDIKMAKNLCRGIRAQNYYSLSYLLREKML